METKVVNEVANEVKNEVAKTTVNNGGMFTGMAIGGGLAAAGYLAYLGAKKLVKKHKSKKTARRETAKDCENDIYEEDNK